ncbi:MAG: ABC transporter permease [Acidobacteriota bacterium]
MTLARITWRRLARRPGQSLLIAGILGLGIGLVAAVWGVAWGTLWRELPFPGADRLHAVFAVDPADSSGRGTLTGEEVQRLSQAFASRPDPGGSAIEGLESWLPLAFVVTGLDHHALQTQGTYITPGLLEAVDVAPILGRKTLQPGRSEAVIGEELWRDHLGGDREVLGRVLTLNDRPTRVVGVMPAGFRFPYDQGLWASSDPEVMARFGWRQALVRLSAEGDPRRARAEVDALLAAGQSAAGEQAGPPVQARRSALEPYAKAYRNRETEKALHLALAAVLALLLVTCANVTNLMLVRGLERRQELAVRAALGAPRGRLVALLAAESLILSAAGAALGCAVAAVALALHGRLAPPGNASWIDIRFDASVLAVAVAAGAFCCLVGGALPAVGAFQASAERGLREGGRTSSAGLRSGRLRRGLVILQVGLCSGLLLAMANMGAALHDLETELAPLARDEVVVLSLSIYGTARGDEADRPAFWRQLRERLSRHPGIRAAAWADDPANARRSYDFEIEIEHAARTFGGQTTVRASLQGSSTSWISR